jgi:centromere protein C
LDSYLSTIFYFIFPGTRRSVRQKVERLDFWRNERIVYSRRKSGLGIADIVRPPKPEIKPLSHKKGYRRTKSAQPKGEDGEHGEGTPQADYAGWDDATDPDGLVWDFINDCEIRRRAGAYLLSVNL